MDHAPVEAALPGTTISRARRTLNAGLWLEVCTRWLRPWLLAVAVVQLVLKTTATWPGFTPGWLLVMTLPVVGAASIRTYRRRYTALEAAAWIDLKSRGGGAWIHAALPGDPACAAAPAPLPPAVSPRLHPGPALRPLALPSLLCLASLVVPAASPSAPVSAAAIQRRAEEVRSRIEEAARLAVLDEEAVRTLEEDIKAAANDAARAPEVAAEAVDQVQQQLERRVLDEARAQREALQAAQALAAQTGQPPPSSRTSSGRAGSAGEPLEPASQHAVPEGDGLEAAGDGTLQAGRTTAPGGAPGPRSAKDLEAGVPSAKDHPALRAALEKALQDLPPPQRIPKALQRELERLAKELGDSPDGLSSRGQDLLSQLGWREMKELAKMLKNARVVRLQEIEQLSKHLKDPRAREQLAALLRDSNGDGRATLLFPGGSGAGLAAGGGSASAAGGIGRGPGAAPLGFGREADGSTARFKPLPLKPGQQVVPGALIGARAVAPEAIPPAEFRAPTRTGAGVDQPDGGTLSGTLSSPHHREVSQRYFSEQRP